MLWPRKESLSQEEWLEVQARAKKAFTYSGNGPIGIEYYLSGDKAARDIRVAGRLRLLAGPLRKAVRAWAVSDGGPAHYSFNVSVDGSGDGPPVNKFRTMVEGAEELNGAVFGGMSVTDAKGRLKGRDPRIRGRVGQLIRAFRLDDLALLDQAAQGEAFLWAPRGVVPYDMVAIANLAGNGNEAAQTYLEFVKETKRVGAAGWVDMVVGHRANLAQRLVLSGIEIRGANSEYDKGTLRLFLWAIIRGGGK